MKTLKGLYVVLGFVSIGLLGCEKQEQSEVIPEKEVVTDKDVTALAVVDLLNQQTNKDVILDELTTNPLGKKLDDIVSRVEPTSTDKQAVQQLRSYMAKSEEVNKLSDETGYVEVPELWLYQPKAKSRSNEVLVTYAPDGDEKNWKRIKAYNLKKEVVYLDAKDEPNVRVIVLETNGFEAMKIKVEYMNKALQKAGLQKQSSSRAKVRAKAANGLETTMLDKISLTDDKEPWVKGAAEIYAVTSGIRDVNGKKEPEVSIIGMPYLDYSGQGYSPNQIMLFWDDYSYQAANIQLFEQDSQYNYKELTKILVDGVTTIAGIISQQPWIPALGKIASAIVEAMPNDWYTDNDDYVDSYYTIMKGKTYIDHSGAANNAKVNLSPCFVPAN